MREFFRRLHYLLTRRRRDAELADEMAFHREMAERNGGVPLGNTLQLREDARESWGWMWIDRLGQDVRYALRTLRAAPGFTISAVLVLAIGIGATVAAFSVVNVTVLRPLPVTDPHSLLRFHRQGPGQFWTDVPYPAVVYYRTHTQTLSAVLALATGRLVPDDDGGLRESYFVTGNFFSELGGTPAAGRLFTTDDEHQAGTPLVVLGHGFWTSRYGARPDIVGQTIRLNGRQATVIGVAAREFSGLGSDAPPFWALLAQHADFVGGSRMLTDVSGEQSGVGMWGRLRRGVTAAAAEDELAALAAALRRQAPDAAWDGERFPSQPGGYAQNVGAVSRGSGPPPSTEERVYPLLALTGTLVLLILAVACGNLGSLLMARGAARQREIALRVAIGAGTSRLIRQLFTESLVLAGIGVLAGLLVGWVVVKVLLVQTQAPAWFDPTPDWRVMVFAAGIGVVSSIAFGLMPAVHIARGRHRMTFARRFLIGAQVASSCVLLIVAGLLVRAVDRVSTLDPGFNYAQTIVIDPALGDHGYDNARARVYLDELETRVRAVAGVAAVARTHTPPLGGRKITAIVEIEGRPHEVFIHQVEAGFLKTLGIPLLRGRELAAGEDSGIVISESLARTRWPNEDPLGKAFRIGAAPMTVIGIAANTRSLALQAPEALELYRLAPPTDVVGMTMVVRTDGRPEDVAMAVRGATKGLDVEVTPRVELVKSRFEALVRDVEQSALAVSLLGAIALAVASLGIAGLVSYAVAQRTKEIGVRMAIGATPAHIVHSLLSQFQRTVIYGLLAGVGGAAALAQLLRQELYGLRTVDPLAYIAAVALFLVVTTLAALIPALRALRVSPVVALRAD